ncbi:extracellular endo-alpha-(1-_5)-L-arabinanase 2 [Anaerocolumna cellulosilytica]|uniref:Extracellular endo-alpha-(1->5)-L-arabinanase 2 n=1 Tax=Anaerocolumna cellulosilytica TaxID=433286 RepID=A0A6S6QVN0_9FIRM|nr:glycoside hydrolase family 43 protein [Anaerocolumna cellulosilytica]MBB5197091.1 arabinan endo-1,5-alpha-L-arabinosidase [Anaerocolumna cellulosilytica]BCJ95303.1 extracellular endo-alpha-(1->5)-L-arabinanase 2 [Anaerocolumna cellulosilytica]
MNKKLLIGMCMLCMGLTAGCADKGNGEIPVVKNKTLVEVEESKDKDNKGDGIVEDTEQYVKNNDKISIGENIKLTADNPVNYSFKNVSVHDPSVIKAEGTYYVFGSHLAGAKTKDFLDWTLIGSGVTANNPIISDARTEMKEAFEWAKTDTFWAPDVIQLADGRFYMYYCTCEGSSPLASLGIAVADKVEGPYKDLGIILKSGMGADMPSEDGDRYDAVRQPNVVDPCLYFDAEGRLWMMYGSYSGGIFVLEMNKATGFPLESGYGKKILGGNHVRIEGPYVQYSPETKYYYLFLSYGGLAADGGYNIRVARSKNPDGPYYDAAGKDMIDCKGATGTFFSDASIFKYGTKLMGNYRFDWIEGEESKIRTGYISPGHNSTFYEEESGKYFLIFHTRFEARGEAHEVRVHQMYMNEDGWPVVSPYRYVGETLGNYTDDEVVGIYKYINHSNTITPEVVRSELIELKSDSSISGAATGSWKLKEDGTAIEITLGEEVYKGVVNIQWDEPGKKNVMTFTALSKNGIAIWGSGIHAIE